MFYPQILDLDLFLPHFLFKIFIYKASSCSFYQLESYIKISYKETELSELTAHLTWEMLRIPISLRQKGFSALEELFGCDPSQPVASPLHDVNILRADVESMLSAR